MYIYIHQAAEDNATMGKRKLQVMANAVSTMERDLVMEKRAHDEDVQREQALGINIVNSTERLLHSTNTAWAFKLDALERKLLLAKTQLKEGQKRDVTRETHNSKAGPTW